MIDGICKRFGENEVLKGVEPDASSAASCSPSSAPTAAASRRCCGARSGCSTPTRAARACAAGSRIAERQASCGRPAARRPSCSSRSRSSSGVPRWTTCAAARSGGSAAPLVHAAGFPRRCARPRRGRAAARRHARQGMAAGRNALGRAGPARRDRPRVLPAGVGDPRRRAGVRARSAGRRGGARAACRPRPQRWAGGARGAASAGAGPASRRSDRRDEARLGRVRQAAGDVSREEIDALYRICTRPERWLGSPVSRPPPAPGAAPRRALPTASGGRARRRWIWTSRCWRSRAARVFVDRRRGLGQHRSSAGCSPGRG